MSNKKLNKQLYKDFCEELADNEEHMAEMAAFAVTCEFFGITEDEAYDLLARFS